MPLITTDTQRLWIDIAYRYGDTINLLLPACKTNCDYPKPDYLEYVDSKVPERNTRIFHLAKDILKQPAVTEEYYQYLDMINCWAQMASYGQVAYIIANVRFGTEKWPVQGQAAWLSCLFYYLKNSGQFLFIYDLQKNLWVQLDNKENKWTSLAVRAPRPVPGVNYVGWAPCDISEETFSQAIAALV